MTTFLLASCSHMQHLTSQVRRKMAATQDGDLGPSRHSVRFMEIVDIERFEFQLSTLGTYYRSNNDERSLQDCIDMQTLWSTIG